MKTKDFNETVRALLTMITKKIDPRKCGSARKGNLRGEFEKLCNNEKTQIYSTMSETKAAFAERTKRSLKSILFCYMEEYGYKYIHNLS